MTCVQNALITRNFFFSHRRIYVFALAFVITVDSFSRSTSIPSSVASIISPYHLLMLNGFHQRKKYRHNLKQIIIKTLKLTIFFTLPNCLFAVNAYINPNGFFSSCAEKRCSFNILALNFNANNQNNSHNLISVLANG